MKYYIKKPKMIAAFMLDFSNAEKTWETLNNLDRCSHILIHNNGDKGYAVKIEGTEKEFRHGDYICFNTETCTWYGRDGHNFEYDWEEVG